MTLQTVMNEPAIPQLSLSFVGLYLNFNLAKIIAREHV